MIAELLSRLNPKATTLQPVPSGVGYLNGHDIANALGKIDVPVGAVNLVRLKWAMQENYTQDVHVSLYAHVMSERFRKIHGHRPGLVFDLCRLAVSEFCQPTVCLSCGGRKQFLSENLLIKCDACKGTGIGRVSKSSRARAVGVERMTWSRYWDREYLQILSVLDGWNGTVLGELKSRIYGS